MYDIVIGLPFLFVLQRFTTSSQKPNAIVRGVNFHQTLLKWSDDIYHNSIKRCFYWNV